MCSAVTVTFCSLGWNSPDSLLQPRAGLQGNCEHASGLRVVPRSSLVSSTAVNSEEVGRHREPRTRPHGTRCNIWKRPMLNRSDARVSSPHLPVKKWSPRSQTPCTKGLQNLEGSIRKCRCLKTSTRDRAPPFLCDRCPKCP